MKKETIALIEKTFIGMRFIEGEKVIIRKLCEVVFNEGVGEGIGESIKAIKRIKI